VVVALFFFRHPCFANCQHGTIILRAARRDSLIKSSESKTNVKLHKTQCFSPTTVTPSINDRPVAKRSGAI